MARPGGATEGALHRLAQRVVVVLRTAAVVTAGGAAVVQAPDGRGPLVVAVVAGLVAWSAWYVRRVPLVADTVVVVALCLAQGWLVRPDALPDITNWVFAVVTVTVVGHQWFTTPAEGAVLTAVLVAAYVSGDVLATMDFPSWTVSLGLWTCVEARFSRLLWYLLGAAARRADAAVSASERASRDATVAAARRADEREHLAVLHDTAAATLFAVGARMVEGTEPWLAEHARRDLALLAAQPGSPSGEADLAVLLGEIAAQAPVSVRLSVPGPTPVPQAPASAIGAAVREALTNVARHAGVGTAEVVVTRADTEVVVEVTDRGRGFLRDEVPPGRRGVAESIEQRMTRVGGRAAVTARPGGGTVVRLAWPRG